MPEEQTPVVSFDDLSEYMARCVGHLGDMGIVTELVGKFFGVATPEEVSMLMNLLSSRVGPSGRPLPDLLEAMREQVKYEDGQKVRPGTDKHGRIPRKAKRKAA